MREIRSPLDGILSPFAARPIDAYAVQGLSPLLVADFTTPYYRKAGSTSTFDSTFTHSRAGNATMVDSDGLIKWAPHNLLTYSEEFNEWSFTRAIVTADFIAMDDTDSNTHFVTKILPTQIIGANYTFEVELKADFVTLAYLLTRNESNSLTQTFIDLTTATVGTDTSSGATATPLADGWVLCSVPFNVPTADTTTSLANIYLAETDGVSSIATAVEGEGFFARNARVYRSDLGGMVNNPDRGDSYVPTTSAAVYQARRNHYTYNGTSWVNSGLLLETEARTNLVVQSEDLSTTWAPNALVTTGTPPWIDVETAPSGADAADFLIPDTNNTFHYTSSNNITTTAQSYTASIFLKAGGYNYGVIQISSDSGFTNYLEGVYNLANGTVEPTGRAANYTGYRDIEDWGDGWFRCIISVDTAVANSTHFLRVNVLPFDTPGPTFSGSGTDGIYVWGAQLEAGSTPSSYMPTYSATFTRPTESLQIAAADMPWNASNVSLQMNGKITYADEGAEAQQTFARWYDDANNYITIDLDTDSTDTGEVNFEQKDGTGGTGTVTADTYSPGILVPYNIASRNTSTAINGATDGTAGTENTTPTALPDLSTKDFSLGYDYMGTIAQFRAWNVDIGDAGIAEASS